MNLSAALCCAARGGQPFRRAVDDAELSQTIKSVDEDWKGHYGAPGIHAELRRAARRHGTKRIARLMRAARIGGPQAERRREATADQPSAAHPGTAWRGPRNHRATRPVRRTRHYLVHQAPPWIRFLRLCRHGRRRRTRSNPTRLSRRSVNNRRARRHVLFGAGVRAQNHAGIGPEQAPRRRDVFGRPAVMDRLPPPEHGHRRDRHAP